MKPFRRMFALGLVMLLVACGGAPTPQLAPLPGDARVLAFGDSLTRGTGAGAADASYPALLAERIGREVINAGEPGEQSAAGLERLPAILDRETPDLLLLCHGGNDLLRNRDEDALRDNLRQMVSLARDRDIPVLMIAVPARALPLRSAGLYRDLADELDLPLVADAVADILASRDLRADPVHPNSAGYARLAEAVHEVLVAAGAVD